MTNGPSTLIVGGGVAGYAVAISLAETGHRVTILDRDLAGPDRLGESLDWEAPRLFEALGISLDELVAQNQATVKRGAVASHAMVNGQLQIGFHLVYRALMALVGRTQHTYHVNRTALTRSLSVRAKELGVELIQARAVRVEIDGDRVLFVEDQSGNHYTADHFVDATGRARVLARALAVDKTKIGPAKLAVSMRMPHGYDHRGTRIRLDDSHKNPSWVWDINISEERTDIGAVFVAEDVAEALRGGMDIPHLFRNELARHDDLGWALDQPISAADLDRCAFQDQVSDRLAGANWFLVGESAAVLDPILSSGITFAIRSGLSAANSINARISNAGRANMLADRHNALLRSLALTVNMLLDALWYRSRLRLTSGFAINVLLLLVCNFNLNHLQSRWFTRTRLGAAGLIAFHRSVRWFVPTLARAIESLPQRRVPRPQTFQRSDLQERTS